MNTHSVSVTQWPQSVVELDLLAREKHYGDAALERLWETHDLLARLFAGRYRGSGRPFISHLAGTAGLAIQHDFDLAEVLAGYAHAAYAQGEFGRLGEGATPENRRELRAVIGAEAEALVVAYDRLDWRASLKQHAQRGRPPQCEEETRVLLLRILNELDDSLDYSVYDSGWCERCLERLQLGGSFAEIAGHPSLAERLRSRVRTLASSERLQAPALRPKQSTTILSPAANENRALALARSVIRRRRHRHRD